MPGGLEEKKKNWRSKKKIHDTTLTFVVDSAFTSAINALVL
jgi:hypothetical protein